MASFLGELGAARPGLGGAGLLLGGLSQLKNKVVKLPFVEKALDPTASEVASSQWKMSAANRMRQLDDVRKHSPLADECAMLNIPDDRLDVHRMQDVLFLAGGCCGVRFKSEEMVLIAQLRGELQSLWDVADAKFQSLESSQKKTVLAGGPYAHSVPASDFSADDAQAEAVVAFHRAADDYLSVVHRLQTLVKAKQAVIPRRSSESGEDLQLALPKFDKDPDSSVGKAMPDWLSTLLVAFQKAQGAPATVPAGEATAVKPPGPRELKAGVTVGKFSAFLSACVVGAVPCSDEEWCAVSQLLFASNDTQTVFTLDGRVLERDDAAAAAAAQATSRGASTSRQQPKPQSYWATRIYNFLASLTELKTMPRDEKALACVGPSIPS